MHPFLQEPEDFGDGYDPLVDLWFDVRLVVDDPVGDEFGGWDRRVWEHLKWFMVGRCYYVGHFYGGQYARFRAVVVKSNAIDGAVWCGSRCTWWTGGR